MGLLHAAVVTRLRIVSSYPRTMPGNRSGWSPLIDLHAKMSLADSFSPHNGCQNVHLTNDHGGCKFRALTPSAHLSILTRANKHQAVDELHSIGPDNGTRCQVFAGADCTHPFYPIHDIPTPDWSIAYPGTAETADAVRSFKCFQG